MSTREKITVHDILQNPKYQSLRDEYECLSSKKETVSADIADKGSNFTDGERGIKP